VSRVSRVCPGSPRCLFTGIQLPVTSLTRAEARRASSPRVLEPRGLFFLD